MVSRDVGDKWEPKLPRALLRSRAAADRDSQHVPTPRASPCHVLESQAQWGKQYLNYVCTQLFLINSAINVASSYGKC